MITKVEGQGQGLCGRATNFFYGFIYDTHSLRLYVYLKCTMIFYFLNIMSLMTKIVTIFLASINKIL